MKKFRYLIICFAALLTGLYFVSCGSDDDNDGDNSDLVGTWVFLDGDSYSGYDEEFVMFCSDGVMYAFDLCKTHGAHVEKMTYAYDKDNKMLYVKEGSYTMSLSIISLSKSSVTLKNGSGEIETYNKATSPLTRSQLEKYYEERSYSSYSY